MRTLVLSKKAPLIGACLTLITTWFIYKGEQLEIVLEGIIWPTLLVPTTLFTLQLWFSPKKENPANGLETPEMLLRFWDLGERYSVWLDSSDNNFIVVQKSSGKLAMRLSNVFDVKKSGQYRRQGNTLVLEESPLEILEKFAEV